MDVWGRRRLAYEVKKNAEGIYAVISLNAEPATVKEFDRQLTTHIAFRASYLRSSTYKDFVINPELTSPNTATMLLSNRGAARYHEFETTVRVHPSQKFDLNFSYVHSRARGDLNTLTALYVPFEQPVFRPNQFGTLPSNIPNRFVTWGRFVLPWQMTASPVLDIHTGFPYSALDARQDYVGAPNRLRLPAFASLETERTPEGSFCLLTLGSCVGMD